MPSTRRAALATLGAAIGGLAGCTAGPFPGGGSDRTVYVGAYHWGFVLFDDSGEELERVDVERGDVLRLVAFNTGASRAVESLPSPVGAALPDHEALEERNEERIPPPVDGDFHERLEEANERYPDHSLAVVSSGRNHMRGGGMTLHPVALLHGATTPVTRRVRATQPGDHTLSCLTYCGYGHPYMEIDGGIVVR